MKKMTTVQNPMTPLTKATETDQKFFVFVPRSGIDSAINIAMYGVASIFIWHELEIWNLHITEDSLVLAPQALIGEGKGHTCVLSASVKATQHSPSKKISEALAKTERRNLSIIMAIASILALPITAEVFDAWWSRLLGFPFIVFGAMLVIAGFIGAKTPNDPKARYGLNLFVILKQLSPGFSVSMPMQERQIC